MVAAASKGIGLATARILSKEGCRISLCGRTESTLEEASESIDGECETYVADVSNPEDMDWWYSQTAIDLGHADILVTNTGGPPTGTPGELTDDQWAEGFATTLMNVVRLSRLAMPSMAAQKWGRIVHISSFVAKEPSSLLTISSTLRAGLCALTKLQAREYGPSNITVNSILPGSTMTDRQLHLAEVRSKQDGITEAQALADAAKQVPLNRIAEPEEIASVIAFLCSQCASYVSGTSLLVDGGLTHALG